MNYHLLWGVWLIWALALLAYCFKGESGWALFAWLIIISPAAILFFIVLFLLRYLRPDKGLMMFKRNISHTHTIMDNAPAAAAPPVADNSETVSSAVIIDREATIIPACCHIKGELTSSGDMKINGNIEGTVTAEKTVYVLNQGNVEGEIHAAKVVVDGKVKGVCASTVVEINASGFIDGTIESDDLSINQSGRFYGISKPLATKQSVPENKPIDQEAGKDKLTMIQQVLNNVQGNIP